MTRMGYIVFALLVTAVSTLINIDTRGGSGGSSSRSWGSGSSGGGWSSGGGGHK